MNATQIEAVYKAFGAAIDGYKPTTDYSFEKALRLAVSFYDLADMATEDSAPVSGVAPTELATVRPCR